MIGVAVLGAGRIGRVHARNVLSTPGCRLVGVADPFGGAASELADALGCRAERDPVALIADPAVDAVVVATPTDTHVALMLEATRLGRAVLCEKPIDLVVERARSASDTLGRTGARVMVGFNRRFDPTIVAMRHALDGDEIGPVRQVIITSRDPAPAPLDYLRGSGGIFRDMTIHDFDLARFLLGEEPIAVQAIASCLVDERIGAIGDDDTIMATLITASGRQCHINNCREAVYGYDQRVEVYGATGMLLNDHQRPSTLRRYTRERTEAADPLLHFFLERYASSYRAELAAFVDALGRGAAFPVTLRDGVRALEIADAALEASRTGRTVAIAAAG